MHKLNVSYNTIKNLLNVIPTYYIEFSDEYNIFVVGDSEFIRCNVSGSDKTNFESNYKSLAVSVASEDDALILGKIKNKTPFVQSKSTDGKIRIAVEKPNISTVTLFSHNWCDKTTWYEKAVRVIEEPTYDGYSEFHDGYVYSLSHTNIIDTYHGKITAEDFLKSSDGYSFRVTVKINNVIKLERDPHYDVDGDFKIDYVNGKIVLFNETNEVVQVIYHYATSSLFTIKPDSGKQLKLSTVDVQFSDDIIPNDSIIFQPYGYVEAFAPQYCVTNGGPYPVNTKIPLGNPIIYKTINDFLNDSKRSYPNYQAIAENSWRGLKRSCVVMNWDYEGEKVLRSDHGMEIRVFLQHDTTFSGTYATSTFYCKTEGL